MHDYSSSNESSAFNQPMSDEEMRAIPKQLDRKHFMKAQIESLRQQMKLAQNGYAIDDCCPDPDLSGMD